MTHVNKHYLTFVYLFIFFKSQEPWDHSAYPGPSGAPNAETTLNSGRRTPVMTSQRGNSGTGEHTLDSWHPARCLSIWTVSQHQARGVCGLTLHATQCVHTICLSVCAILYMLSLREQHLQCCIQRALFMSLFTSASTYSTMAEPLTWFSNATNVFYVQKIWPWNYRTDETASEWARLALYRLLCLTPTAV